jgi:hypothetical protein
MKTSYLFVTTVVALSAHFAQAEVVTYKGTINDKSVILTLDVQLPSVVTTTITPPFTDGEMGPMPGSTSIDATLGSYTVTFGKDVSKGDLFASGAEVDKALQFEIDAFFAPRDLQGLDLDAPALLTSSEITTSLNRTQDRITDIRFPASFSVRWYINGMYDSDGARNGTVRFVKQ